MNNDFWLEVEKLLIAPEKITLEYRLHYNELGEIYLGTTHDHPNNTQYLTVDQTEYEQYYRYRVVDNKLKKIEPAAGYHVQLKLSSQGTATVAGHAGIVIEPGEEYPDITYYEYRNH